MRHKANMINIDKQAQLWPHTTQLHGLLLHPKLNIMTKPSNNLSLVASEDDKPCKGSRNRVCLNADSMQTHSCLTIIHKTNEAFQFVFGAFISFVRNFQKIIITNFHREYLWHILLSSKEGSRKMSKFVGTHPEKRPCRVLANPTCTLQHMATCHQWRPEEVTHTAKSGTWDTWKIPT